MKWPLALLASLLLSNCIDPYAMNMGRDPYRDPYGSEYRADMRDQGRQLAQMAYERGIADGQYDAQQRQSQNYNRHRTRYDRSTEMPYRDGYNQGYSQANSSLGHSYLPNPGVPGYPAGPGAIVPSPAPQANDPAYQQGYDYGLRDRTGGRVADPAAHVGRYDPRRRASFERGYHDGYNARSSMSTPSSGGSGRFWSL
ncbi:MAG: hypothetical protein JNG86_01900 [Verrucomicrobiaceae bacterium]|nr:hypothetical protein [Verrucomicrobiaceae bacterium]